MVPKTAFYFKPVTAKTWRLIGIYDSAEQAWRASLDHPGSGDVWFPQLDGDTTPSSELTSLEARRFRMLRLVTV